jgi:hypothetical protein
MTKVIFFLFVRAANAADRFQDTFASNFTNVIKSLQRHSQKELKLTHPFSHFLMSSLSAARNTKIKT